MKKSLILFFLTFLTISCGQKDTTSEKTQEASATLDKDTVFSFSVENISTGCDSDSEIVCTINLAVKCTLNPDFSECKSAKDKLPSFVFMQDETLQRPTFQSYKITKLKPRSDGAVEVYTQSSCNGNWFGLCNGNIIYVMKNYDSQWYIIDMYALEF